MYSTRLSQVSYSFSLSFYFTCTHSHKLSHTATHAHTYIRKYRCAITVTMYFKLHVWKSAVLWPLWSYLSDRVSHICHKMLKCLRDVCDRVVVVCLNAIAVKRRFMFFFFFSSFMHTETKDAVVVWCWTMSVCMRQMLYRNPMKRTFVCIELFIAETAKPLHSQIQKFKNSNFHSFDVYDGLCVCVRTEFYAKTTSTMDEFILFHSLVSHVMVHL